MKTPQLQYIRQEMSTLKQYLSEAISSGKGKYYLDITPGYTTIPEFEEYLEIKGFVKVDDVQYATKNYAIDRSLRETYLDIVNPEDNQNRDFIVLFGSPKRRGRLTMTEIHKFVKGDPYGKVSSPEELYDYINY